MSEGGWNGWNGEPPAGTPDGSWHILLDDEGDEYRGRWVDHAWRFDPPWYEGGWGGKEVEPWELTAIGFSYGRPITEEPAP